MNKKAFTPLMIFGLVWLAATLVSWFAFPGWQTIPGGFWTLAGVAALGVLAFLKDGVAYIKSFLEISPKDPEKPVSPSIEQHQEVHVHLPSVAPVPASASLLGVAPGSGVAPTSGVSTYIPRGIEGEVSGLLRRKQHAAVVGVSAPGGIGKSELAQQVSKELIADGTFQRMLWVDCGPRMSQDIVMSMLRECQVNIPPNCTYIELVELLKGFLSGQNWLLILDDVREPNRAQINDLLPPESACAALLTSRIQQISPRVKMIPLNPMSDKQARQLLESELDAGILRKESSAIHDLIARCKNNSLALLISARQIQSYHASGAKTPVALHLGKIASSLKHLNIPNSDPRFDLFGVFEVSYTDLSAADQARFRALAVFDRSGFSLSAAAYVWNDDEDSASTAIRGLLNLSLLKIAATALERYQLHDLLDEYAEYKLKQVGGEDVVFTRMAEWLIGLFGEHYNDYADSAPEVTFELNNLQKVIAWAIAQQRGPLLAQLATRPRNWLFNYWREWDKWQSWLEESLRFGMEDQRLEANVLQALGNVQQFRKEMDGALESYNEALKLYKVIGAKLGEANVLQALGNVQQFRTEMDGALESYNEALKLFRAFGDRLGEANVLLEMGAVQEFRDDRDGALESYNEALKLYKVVGAKLGEANVRKAMGDLQRFRKEMDGALKSYNEALKLFKVIGDHLGEANVLRALGAVQWFRKEMDGALESYNEALKLYKVVGDRLGEANVRKSMGDVQQFRKEMDGALESYNEALKLYKVIGSRLGEANVLMQLSCLAVQRGEIEEAEEQMAQITEMRRAIGAALYSEAADYGNFALVLLEHGHKANAKVFFLKARTIFEQLNMPQFFGMIDKIIAAADDDSENKLEQP